MERWPAMTPSSPQDTTPPLPALRRAGAGRLRRAARPSRASTAAHEAAGEGESLAAALFTGVNLAVFVILALSVALATLLYSQGV
jgi:hypothetical protein